MQTHPPLQFQQCELNLTTESQLYPAGLSPIPQIPSRKRQLAVHTKREPNINSTQELTVSPKQMLRECAASIIRRMFKYDTVEDLELLRQLAEDLFPVRQHVAEYVIKNKRARTLKQNINLLKETAKQHNLQSIAFIYKLLEDQIKSHEEHIFNIENQCNENGLHQSWDQNHINIDKEGSSTVKSPILSLFTSFIWNQASSLAQLWRKQDKVEQTPYEQAYLSHHEYEEGWWSKYTHPSTKDTSVSSQMGSFKND